jgi:hypothetical protein
MSVIYPDALKRARMDANTTYAGTTAVLELGSAGFAAILVRYALSNPIAPASTGAGVLTLSGWPRTSAALAGGTLAAARILTAIAGSDVVTGLTVGLAASTPDVTVDNTNVANGQNVTCNGATITHAA